jgi:hypothetical protein
MITAITPSENAASRSGVGSFTSISAPAAYEYNELPPRLEMNSWCAIVQPSSAVILSAAKNLNQ